MIETDMYFYKINNKIIRYLTCVKILDTMQRTIRNSKAIRMASIFFTNKQSSNMITVPIFIIGGEFILLKLCCDHILGEATDA